MRARWLKPEFFTDKKIAQMDPLTALVFQALWCMADDGGTAEADPEVIKAKMFYRWSAVGVPEISGALRHLFETARITIYSVGDEQYAQIRHWRKHQSVHKPSAFRYPKPLKAVTAPTEDAVPHQSGTSAEDSGTPHVLDSKNPRHPITTNNGAKDALMENAFAEVCELLPPEFHGDLTVTLEALPDRTRRFSWLNLLKAKLNGMHPPKAAGPIVGQAIRQFNANGESNWKRFEGYIRLESLPPSTRSNGHRSRRSNAAEESIRNAASAFEDIPE